MDKVEQMVFSDKRLPLYIRRIIINIDLMSIDNVDDRFDLFLIELHRVNPRLSYQTIVKYIIKMDKYFFPGRTKVLDPKKYKIHAQDRYICLEDFYKFANFIEEQSQFNEKAWPILFAILTGLRLSEVVKMKQLHISQLLGKESIISLQRKNKQSWKPVYHEQLNEFVKFLKDKIDPNQDQIFLDSKSSIHYHLKQFYNKCFNRNAPFGFGLHFIRYALASILNREGRRKDIPTILGHTSDSTANKYIQTVDGVNKLLATFEPSIWNL